MRKKVLITGATAGIGKATAYLLAKKGYALILTGRRTERLQEIKSHLEENYSADISTLCFDLSKRKECEDIFNEYKDILSQTNILINNAGLARATDSMDQANIDDWEEMIDTNIKGLLYMTRLCLPYLKSNSPSHIVNVASVAGRWVYPGGGVYCSTKFAVRALTEGLRMDLNGSNVRITNISPGMVETEFSLVRLRDEEKAKHVYDGVNSLTAEDIAESIVWSLERPLHVNIQELVIFPTDQASVGLVHRKNP